MSIVDRRRGWCPGALRPMRTGDGLLVRLRISAGILAPAMAIALADLAQRHGNGLIDLTSRANLQLRGIADETLPRLLEGLEQLDLLDDSAEAERVRNIIVSPLAGLDPSMSPRTLDVVRFLEARLGRDKALHALPAKFGFLVDGGGVLQLDDVEADVALKARDDGFDVEAGGRIVAFGRPEAAAESAAAAALSIIGQRQLGLQPPLVDRAVASRRPRRRIAGHDRRAPGFFVAAAPYGQLDAGQLHVLAHVAADHDAGLRLTPWRAILLVPVSTANAPRIASRLAAAGLVVDPTDPRLAVAACSGRPSCLSGEADVRRDAAIFAKALAPRLGAGGSLHVSGCPKGCAHRGPADVTLVAEAGRYRLALDADASAPVAGEGLTVEAMATRLAGLATPPLFAESPTFHVRTRLYS